MILALGLIMKLFQNNSHGKILLCERPRVRIAVRALLFSHATCERFIFFLLFLFLAAFCFLYFIYFALILLLCLIQYFLFDPNLAYRSIS